MGNQSEPITGEVGMIKMVKWVGYFKTLTDKVTRQLECLFSNLAELTPKVNRRDAAQRVRTTAQVNITTSLFDWGKSQPSSPQLTTSHCPAHTPIHETILNISKLRDFNLIQQEEEKESGPSFRKRLFQERSSPAYLPCYQSGVRSRVIRPNITP